MLFKEFGEGESLPPQATKEFILQSLHHMCIGAKLNEAAAKYTYEGATNMYVGCTGLDAEVVINMFCELFGEVDLAYTDLKTFETAEVSAKCRKADEALDKAKESSTSEGPSATPPDPKLPKGKGVQHVYPSSIPILVDIFIAKEFVPNKLTVDEPSTHVDGQNVTKKYYQCKFCNYDPQNKTSEFTHTHRHLDVKLLYRLCNYTSESAGPLQMHIIKMHDTHLSKQSLSQSEIKKKFWLLHSRCSEVFHKLILLQTDRLFRLYSYLDLTS